MLTILTLRRAEEEKEEEEEEAEEEEDSELPSCVYWCKSSIRVPNLLSNSWQNLYNYWREASRVSPFIIC